MHLMFQPLKKYADFKGRATRSEYWLFFLFASILGLILGLFDGAMGFIAFGGYGLLTTFFFLAILIPSIAVLVRRLHDRNMSGWWALVGLIPFGGLALLVICVLPGTAGKNRFG